MAVHRLNHAVLFVRSVAASTNFYREALGFEPVPGLAAIPGAAFLQAPGSTNDHDLGLFEVGANASASTAGRNGVGLYHLAWEVDTLEDLRDTEGRLRTLGALVGASDHGTTKALYGRDPDGLEFEVCWLVPADRLTDEATEARSRIGPLDIEAEITRYGATTRSGVGISRIVPSPA